MKCSVGIIRAKDKVVEKLQEGLYWIMDHTIAPYIVSGRSMEPTLYDGYIVLATPNKRYYEDEIVVAEVDDKIVIKRVVQVLDSKIFLQGDNPEHSLDSRHYGFIDKKQIKGKVFKIKKPKGRN